LTRAAAELAARQYELALRSLAGRNEAAAPLVFTCSALLHEGVDAIWKAIERRQERWQIDGGLTERRRRQALRWMWAIVENRLRQAIREHPAVQAMRPDVERQVLAGALPPEAAARQIPVPSGSANAAAVARIESTVRTLERANQSQGFGGVAIQTVGRSTGRRRSTLHRAQNCAIVGSATFDDRRRANRLGQQRTLGVKRIVVTRSPCRSPRRCDRSRR
jgi:hypothetical protein